MKIHRTGLFLIIIYSRLFSTFANVANDLHFAFLENLKEQLTLPMSWSARGAVGLGEYAVFVLWNWPLNYLFGVLGGLGLPYTLLIKCLGFGLFIIVAVWSISRILEYLNISEFGRLIGILFYLSNSYILLLLDGGQLNLALAYSLLPLTFLLYKKGEETKSLKGSILFAISTIVLSIFDIRILYLLALLIFLNFLVTLFLKPNSIKDIIGSNLKMALLSGAIFVGFHAYWIIPSLFARAPSLPTSYGRVFQVDLLSFASLGHSLTLLQPHWYRNVFGKITELKLEFMLIPLLVLLAPIFRRKDKNIAFWLIVLVVGIFMIKGANPPLPQVYPWLFTHMPGLSFFRDPTKFFFLVALSYSVLIGITVDEVSQRLSILKIKSGFLKSYILNPKTFVFLLAVYFLLLVRPIWLGQMTGTFSPPIYQNEYEEINSLVEKDSSFGRVFWIPTKAPLGYSSFKHPSVEASRLVEKRPFAIGTVGTYEIFNYLREAPFMGELFDVAGIRYIVYPYPDTRREELKQDNIDYYYAFLDQLSNLPWVESRVSDPPVPLLKVKEAQDHFFITNNTYLVIGSDKIYNDLVRIEGFKLSNNALIFAEEQPAVGNTCKDRPCTVILYDKNEIDYAATFIDKSNFIFPAGQLEFSPSANSGSSGWWKRETLDLLWWRNFLQEKYGIDNQDFDFGGGWAVAEGDKQLTINDKKFTKDNKLLARLMLSNRGGRMNFFQGDQEVGEIDTRIEEPEKVEIKLTGYAEIPDQIFEYDESEVRWFEIGNLVSDQHITIKAEGEINVVNSLVSLPQAEFDRLRSLVYKDNIIHWESLGNDAKNELVRVESSPQVSYQRINPTHYKVSIEKIASPVTLAFSETYDPLWEITNIETGQKNTSYPLYSLINGFYVDKDGEYEIYFSPQKYVYPGLAISGMTVFGIIALLYYSRKRQQ